LISSLIASYTHRTLNPRTATAFRRPNGKPLGHEGAKARRREERTLLN